MTERTGTHMGLIQKMTLRELLIGHVQIAEELRTRNVLRSANNPTGDLAEHLFHTAFGWQLAANSERGFDAKGGDGIRYQIKGRRIDRRNPSRELSAIRNLDDKLFDMLAAVLFDHYYDVMRAALIPWTVVKMTATYVQHTNSHKFLLTDAVWDVDGVADVTEKIRKRLSEPEPERQIGG